MGRQQPCRAPAAQGSRSETLAALNALGALHRVRFDPHLLLMEPTGDERAVAASKRRNLQRLREAGHRIVAVVDNEPEMLRAMAELPGSESIVFLRADTIFLSRRETLDGIASGATYSLAGLVDRRDLARRVTFVWHRVNDRRTLARFLASEVRWAGGRC